MTDISREQWQIEKQNKNKKSREFYEEFFERKVNPVARPGKEILIMIVFVIKIIIQIKNKKSALMEISEIVSSI